MFAKVQKLSFDAIFLDKGVFLNNFFSELKRRNVVRVAIAYAVVSWVILQFVDIIQEIVRFPDWFPQMVLVLLIIGLPIALIFSWAYEVTPEGVKKTAEVDKSKSLTHGTGQKINKLIGGALILAVGFIIYDKTMSEDLSPVIQDAETSTPSIAVLPFINMSADPTQEFFSDGITEEILNVLAKNQGLLVTARTSAFSYKGQNKDIRTIGQELGVDNILEGSVRHSEGALRITAQLIRVSDGFHLWSETYDRKLENIFVLQEEIAFAISDALQTPLGIEKGQLVQNRTTDMGAYELYLQARQLVRKRGVALEEAVIILDEVIAREPGFAPAWATQSLAYAVIPNYLLEFRGAPTNAAEVLFLGETAAFKAVTLDPNLADAHFAMAQSLRWRRLWGPAEEEYLKAYALDPNNVEILEDLAEFYYVVGRYKEGLNYSEKGYKLEPLLPLSITSYATNLSFNGRHKEAEAMFKKALELSPGFSWPVNYLRNQYIASGDVDKAIELVEDCELCRTNSLISNDSEILIKYRDGELTPEEIRKILESNEKSTTIGIVYLLGGIEAVLDKMEGDAFGKQNYVFLQFWGTPYASDLVKTSRFKRLVKYLGLADYWRVRGWPDMCHPVGEEDFECD